MWRHAGCDTDQLSICQKQLLVCRLQRRLLQVLDEAVQQQPILAGLVTYQQQQQRSSSWILQGIPTSEAVGAAASDDSTSNTTGISARAGAPAGAEGAGAAFPK